jgi:hypothetical protein
MPGRQVYSVGGQGQSTITDPCIIASRNPATTDLVSPNGYPYAVGQQWQNSSTQNVYEFLGASAGAANWRLITATTGDIVTLSDTASTSVTPDTNGNVKIEGTTNQVNSTAGTNKLTLSIPATFSAPGTVTAATGLIATAGGVQVSATSVAGTTPIVNNVRTGQAAFSDDIAAGAYGTLVVTNSVVTGSSVIIASASCSSATSAVQIVEIAPGSGTVSFRLFNAGASTAAATININFWVLN